MQYFINSPLRDKDAFPAKIRIAHVFLSALLSILFFPGIALSDSGFQTENSPPVLLGGSTNGGSVVGASVTVRDKYGRFLASTTSSEKTHYRAFLPADAALPVTISATGGIDVVTGRALAFPLLSAAMDADGVANLSPFSTLIVKTAQAMSGGLNAENLNLANKKILKQFGFGIDAALIPDLIKTKIAEHNIASLVKGSEAFAETVRRTRATLREAGTSINEEQLIDALAADMVDGQIDGIGAENVNPVYSITTVIVSGSVLLEAFRNNLHVNDVWATNLLDNAILISVPAATDTVADVVATADVIAQLKRAVSVALVIAPSEALSAIAGALDHLSRGGSVASAGALLATANRSAFNEAIAQAVPLVLSDSKAIDIFNIVGDSSMDEKLTILSAQVSGYDAGRGRVAENAIDGDLKTKWTTLNMPQWISLDLGDIRPVSKTRLLFYGAKRGVDFDYTVSVSTDNANWSVVARNAVFNASPAWTELSFNPTKARYVRIALNSKNLSDYANVYEIEVYGSTKPLLDFAVADATVDYNGVATLTWDSLNSTSCDASGAWTGTYSPMGTATIGPLLADSIVTLTCFNGEGQSTRRSISISVSAPKMISPLPDKKLAILSAQVSGYDAGRGRVAENAIDGDLKTKWTTLSMPQWISLDLGDIRPVSKTRILFYGAKGGVDFDYTVSVSTDNANWSVVARNAVFKASPAWTELSFNPTKARYVRIALNSKNISDYANVYEIEVYGNTKGNVVNDASDNISLSWNANQDSVLGYVVYHGETADTAFQTYVTVNSDSYGFDPEKPRVVLDPVSELGYQPGDSICFRVRAFSSKGLSGWPTPVCGAI